MKKFSKSAGFYKMLFHSDEFGNRTYFFKNHSEYNLWFGCMIVIRQRVTFILTGLNRKNNYDCKRMD